MIFGMWVRLGLKLRMLNFGRGRCLLIPNLHNLCKNLSGAYPGNRMPQMNDIWCMGRARAEGAHGDLDGGQRSSEVKWGKLCAMATIFGQKKP